MSAAPDPDPDPASAPGPTLEAWVRQADEQLRALQQTCEAQGRLLRATVGHLRALAESQAGGSGLAPTYRVFEVAVTRQHIVLRDVETLCGATPVFTTTSFAEALRWANTRLADLIPASTAGSA